MNPEKSHHKPSSHIIVKKERDFHIGSTAKERPELGKQGAQDGGCVAPEQSVLLGGLGEGTHTAPAPGRVYTGSYMPSCNAKVCWCAPGGPAQPGHLTVFCHHTTLCPPGPKSSPAGPGSAEPGQWQKAAVGLGNAGQALLRSLSFGVCKAGCRDPAWASRPPLGLQWKKASLKSKKK